MPSSVQTLIVKLAFVANNSWILRLFVSFIINHCDTIRSQQRFFVRFYPDRGLCRGKMSVRLSVRQSVCLSETVTPVLSLNGYTYPQSFCTIG